VGKNCSTGGQCVNTSSVCTPNCAGKVCGDNGCNGSCGTCASGKNCSSNWMCIAIGCTPNCTGKVCGSDGCNGTCGTCAVGKNCSNGACIEESTLTGLDAYPSPFVYAGKADVTIIYGADAPSIHVDVASIFSSDLANYLMSQSGTKLGSVALSDTQAEVQMPTTNLIVIGGPDVNRVAAKLAGVAYPTKDAGITTALGYKENEALLKLYSSPYSAAKIALLVTGWTGDDVKIAAKNLTGKTMSFGGKEEIIFSTGTLKQTAQEEIVPETGVGTEEVGKEGTELKEVEKVTVVTQIIEKMPQWVKWVGVILISVGIVILVLITVIFLRKKKEEAEELERAQSEE